MPKEKEKRPPCPECHSTHVLSRGIDWTCGDCGLNWRKKYRPPKHLYIDTATVNNSNKVEDV